METNQVIEILKNDVDIKLLLNKNIFKAVLNDLLFAYETERKILIAVNLSVNVVEKLYKNIDKLITYQTIKRELSNFGFNDETIIWALTIWTGVLDIQLVQNDDHTNINFINISTGVSFTIATFLSDKVFSWGSNNWGQLGHLKPINEKRPNEITNIFNLSKTERIKNVYTSFRSSFLLTTKGRLFSFGNNSHGQLGNGTITDVNEPIDITNQFKYHHGEIVEKFETGGLHSLLLTSFNRLFTWGNNDYGQLGDGTNHQVKIPNDISEKFPLKKGEKIVNLGAGLGHSLLTTSLERVFTWGNNEYGQLGDGTTTKRNKPSEITDYFNFNHNEKIIHVSLGSLHSILVTSNGRLFTWGNNEHGQLGDMTIQSRLKPIEITNHFKLLSDEKVVFIQSGRDFSLALTTIGQVYAWGNNKNGQLGMTDYVVGNKAPINITKSIIKNDEDWVVKIVTGPTSSHCFAITSTKKIFCWGNNDKGQLGDGTTQEQRIPIESNF